MSNAHDAILDRLGRLHPRIIDLSLDRVFRLLAALGDPHRSLPPVVHVAGTNGKGSVVAFLRAFLEAAGYRVHVATSPHLVRFNERIRLAGALISDADLAAVLADCEAANDGAPITFFEITTVAALLAFARVPADIVLLETGLGGRLDATNVVDRPLLTAITPVSLDHQQFLGKTLAAIAGEKAGILKPGVPCVLAAQPPAAAAAIAARAAAVGAPLIGQGREWRVRSVENGMRVVAPAGVRRLPPPRLAGAHQRSNAAQAVAMADSLPGFTLSDDALARGLQSVDWPARLQRLTRGPLVDRLPPGWELWLDGGHNPAAGRSLAVQARQWRDRPLHLVFGMLASKQPAAFLAPLAADVAALRGVAIPDTDGGLSAESLVATARRLAIDAAPAAGVGPAIESLVAANAGPARVLVCGSLYLAGSVLRENA